MYERFYRFSAPPFQLAPDPRFFFGSSGHSRAFSHLVFGLSQEEGFIVVTGEVGAGKTTLVEQLCSQLDPAAYAVGRIATTLLSADELLRLIASRFGVNDDGDSKAALLRHFEQMLCQHRAAGRRCLLVVDEVQNLSLSALEELRMLSNIMVEGRACLQTLLLGQPQFRSVLAGPNLEQLRQRVLASHHLGPLSESETRAYVEHRLGTVAWNGDPQWTDEAFTSLFRHTGGIPRRINTLCSRVLLLGALEEAHTISAGMVAGTAQELEQDLGANLAPELNGANSCVRQEDESRLFQQVQALERRLQLQERLFHRILDGAATCAGLRTEVKK